MRSFSARLMSGALLFAGIGAAFAAPAGTPAKAPAANAVAKPAAGDPSTLSTDFWGNVRKTTASDEFSALKAAVGCADKTTAATAAPNTAGKQRIVDLAVVKPDQAAKLLSGGAAASKDPAADRALATVVAMVVPPKTIEAAAPLVAPEEQARVTEMRANLSTGIPGLPGIYLGEVDHPKYEAGGPPAAGAGTADPGAANGTGDAGASSSGERGAAPAGYEPVSGSSMGCPAR